MQSSMIKSITEDFGNGGTIDGDLTISGDLQVSGGGSLSFDEIVQGTQVIDVTNTEALLVRKNDDGGDVFVVDTTNSRVGIGASSPSMTLEISNTSFGDQLRLHRSSVASGGFLTLSANDSAGNIHDYAKLGTVVESSTNASEDGALVFQTSLNSTLTEYMRITSTGNVGIGTDSPTHNLNVYNGSGASNMTIGKYASGKTVALLGTSADTSGYFQIQSYASQGTTFGNIALNAQGGNVGIGTTSPSQLLSVAPDTDVSAEIGRAHIGNIGYSDMAGFSHIDLNATNTFALAQSNLGKTIIQSKSGQIIAFKPGGSDKVAINSTGLGIGTDSPDYQLELEKAGGGFLSFKTTDTEIVNNDVLGTIQFGADDATASGIDIGAKIVATATDNFQSASSNVDAPTKLEFFTQDNTTTDVMSTVGATLTLGGDDQNATFAGDVYIKNPTSNDPATLSLWSADTSIADNDNIGVILAQGSDSGGSPPYTGAKIEFNADAVWDTGTSNYYATRIDFFTQSNSGADTLANPALTIDSSQNATFNGDTLSLVKSNNNAFLKIESTDGGEAIFEMRATTNRTNQIRFFEGATQRGSIVYAHASQSLTFNTGDSATAKLVLDDNSRISLSNNDSGTSNTVFGKLAGDDLASGGNYNSLFGESAGHAITTGDGNVIMGHTAGQALTTGVRNVLLGRGAGLVTTNAQHLIGIGFYSLSSVNSADASGAVAVGYESLKALTSGAGNTSIGYQSSEDVTTGEYNTVMGYQAFSADTDGSANVAIGWKAGRNIHGSTQNVMIGYKAMANMDNNPGDNIANCVAIGYEAFLGSDNDSTGTTTATNGTVAIGHSSLKVLTTGIKNTAIGFESGLATSTGSNNTYVGYEAGQGASGSENNNTGIGKQSLFAVTTAESNVAVGTNTLDELTTGGYNTAIGANALHALDGGETENVAIGYNAGSNADGATNNICIGSNALLSTGNGTNQIVIGKDTTGVANNSVTLGNASVTDVYMAQDQRAKMHSGQIETIMDSSTNANIAVIRSENTSNYSSSVLHVTGDRTTTNNTYNLANFTNAGTSKCIITDGGDLKNTNNSYGAISDEKLKQDIEDASSQWDDIKAVRFRKFKFKDNVEDGFKLGVVAQELEKVSPSLISESIDRDADGKDLGTTTKSVKYSILQMKGIVALQEALNRIETLEAKVKELESK